MPSMINAKISVTYDIVSDPAIFLSMRDEWNGLLDKSGIKNPFLRHEWLTAWWRAYGMDKKLLIFCLKKDGCPAGFAPLMKYKTKLLGLPLQAIGFISNHWVGMDFIVDRENMPMFLAELKNFLKKEKEVAVLSYFPEDSAALAVLDSWGNNGVTKIFRTDKHAPFITSKGTWKDYLAERTHRFRREYKKKLEAAESQGKPAFVRFTTDISVDETVRQLKTVSEKSWQGQKNVAILSSSQGEVFYKKLLEAWVAQGLVDISFLKLNERTIAYLVGFNADGHFYVFDTAFDEEFRELSPGMLIHNMLLERLFGEGFKIFDFGYVADYKKRWTEEETRISDLTIFPAGLRGKCLWALNKLKIRIKKGRND